MWAASRGAPVDDSPELQRVLRLPRRPQIDLKSLTAEAIIERETKKYRKDRELLGLGPCSCAFLNPEQGCLTRFLAMQALVLREMAMVGGVIAAAPVGGGKTALGIFGILALGLTREKKQQGLLMIPSNLMEQFIADYDAWSEHFIVPEIVVHMPGRDVTRRVPGQPILHVMAHSMISLPQYSTFIEDLLPTAILIDELDAFGHMEAARTKRLDRALDECPDTMFGGWTGSLTNSSLKDFAHLFAYAFGDGSPLPLNDTITEDWSRCLDATDSPCRPGALMQLVGPEDVGNNDMERVKRAFRRRLAETPGFIVTGTAEVRVTGADGKLTDQLVRIELERRSIPSVPQIVQQGLDLVRDWKRPDTLVGNDFDEPLLDSLSQAKCAREVACGMFYRWRYPRGEPKALIEKWFLARQEFFSEMREVIARGQRNLDSKKLCEDAARRAWGDLPEAVTEDKRTGEVRPMPVWKASSWPQWRDVMDLVQPEPEACRLHPFIVEDAVQWGTNRRGMIWYSFAELGQWIHELSGYPLCTGGPGAGDKILKVSREGDQTIIASTKSHGRGRNKLQYFFHEHYVLNTLSSNTLWEQLLGRTHRMGQKSDVVRCTVPLHTVELMKSFNQALRCADYVDEGILAQVQKLRLADSSI